MAAKLVRYVKAKSIRVLTFLAAVALCELVIVPSFRRIHDVPVHSTSSKVVTSRSFIFETVAKKVATERQLNITVELVGLARLGNLMFGHASMLGIADRTGRNPVVSTKNGALIKSFDLATRQQTIDHAVDWTTCEERFPSVYDDTLLNKISNAPGHVLLFGYFQSWRYFDHIRTQITNDLRFKKSIAVRASEILETITKKRYPSAEQNQTLRNSIVRIGVHVRRGDMLAQTSVDQGFTVASPDYIRRAMDYVAGRLQNSSYPASLSLLYVVVSDDIAWCLSNIDYSKHPVEFILEKNDPAVDLAVLSSCNHTVATVGTFSWWAGYLAGGITVYYKDFPAPGSQTAQMFRADDYYHPSWIGMS